MSTPQDRNLLQGKHLRTSEQSKLQAMMKESKPTAPSEEKPLLKLPGEAPKVPESASPKGKSMAAKPEAESKASKAVTEAQQVREQEETGKPYPHDLSRSPQSLSDTGYSSDGISSSQSEITGLVQQEEEQLNGTGLEDQSPASPSELTKLESSVRPLLESKGISQEQSNRGRMYHELREEQRQRQRPRSLSITPEAFDSDEELEDIMEEDEDSLEWENQRDQRESVESSDDLGSKLRHDYVEDSSEGGVSPLPSGLKGRETEMTDEEFMRRQILEMSAEEDNLEEEEEYSHVKHSVTKSGHKPDLEKSKEPTSSKRRLPHVSTSMYEEERKELEVIEGEDVTTSQGGLRRFKTIELNSTSSYSRDMELSQDADISLDREPELEMESLTGSPEERSRGEYSSTLPATTPSYTSGTSPTSLSSLEEDSDSSPSRRQRLEEVKQQRKARHRSHGPLLPTIEDSSEEDELREEEELLREQEKMREVEQQRIRSTARKTKRDKEELRAQRRRERSKTPPSNLSPIEDASPTEELRQAAEMEELHRSSCSEYSPSIDSEAEGFDVIASKLYKSGSEYNLPTFMSLYSPTEKTNSISHYPSSKPLKSAEEAYEEMMRKAELFQKQQVQQSQQSAYSNTYQQVGYHSAEGQSSFEYQYIEEYSYDNGHMDSCASDFQHELSEPGAVYEEILQTSQSISRMHQSSSFDLALEEEKKKKGREETYQEKQFLNAESAYADLMKQNSGPLTPGTSPTQLSAPVSFSSSEDSTGRVIPDVRVTQHFAKEGHDHPKLHSSPAAPSSAPKVMTAPYTYSRGFSTVTTVVSSPASAPRIYSSPSLSGSDVTPVSIPSRSYSQTKGTVNYSSQTEDGSRSQIAAELCGASERENLQSTTTTVSITVDSSMLVSQPKQPLVYGDPFQNRMDFGQGAGSPVCLTHVKQVEQAVQTGTFRGSMSSIGISVPSTKPETASPQQTKFARYNLPNQMMSLVKKDVLISQTSSAQSAVSISTSPRPILQDQSTDLYRGVPVGLKTQSPPINLGGKKSQTMMVQMNEIAAVPVTKLIKEPPPASALDLTGIKPESQVACCDVVYKFPFGSSCTGTFNPSPKIPEKNIGDAAQTGKPSIQYYGNKEPDLPETYPYREQTGPAPSLYEEQRFYPQGLFGRLYSSMSDTNLSEIGLNYYPPKAEQPFHSPSGDSAVDLTTMKHSYSISFTEGGYLGQGMQYGSFSDLRQPTDLLSHSLPMRRYSSASNIYSDYKYSPRGDLANFQESSLAQYSATTAREISRMCAALNSMDQYGARHSNSADLLQYGPAGGSGISAPQGISAIKPNNMYNPNFPETRQYSLSGARLGAVRQIFPSTATVRAADGMIYSTINTPIASTLPITTQPASVLRPMLRGLYRPYTPGNITAVPLASLTRVPLVTPRVPFATQGLYRYSAPSRFPFVSTTSVMEMPMYLGKPVSTTAASTAASNVSPVSAAKAPAPTAMNLQRPEQTGAGAREEVPMAAAGMQSASKEASQPQQPPPPVQTQQAEVSQASVPSKGSTEREEKEEERQRKQQEHILQIERERVELEKLRQLRLHEELERERVELQRHREKEQMLVHREIQELQSIKHQVLQQQQEERQAQFALQREQLAQQRLQLEQIQHLQQQLQQQLEEQKRQKSTFPPVCDPTGRIPPQAVSEIAMEMQRTLAQNGQYWPPLNQPFMAPAVPGQEGPAPSRYSGLQRPLTNSTSEISLQPEEQWEASQGIKKRNSMPRLRDTYDKETPHEPYVVKKITDSSVQTDEEDGEERYFLSRRRRSRRSTDCSVQTDEEDNAEWEQPVRRRRSRFSRHSDSSSESKQDSSSKGMASIGIQTSSDCSVQTEPDQLPRVSPSIHITTPDPKVKIVKYISAPEKTQRGESLACQTELEAQPQPGIVVPQLTVPTTITPYSSNLQLVSTGPLDPRAIRQQALGKFEKKKPDPLEIGYQSHLPAESLSQLVTCQPPKSPQVLYSPVSPLSPHRLLESSFTASERLNKAHVTPQKHFTADSIQRQQTLPRPIKTMQRSFSDPKPTSPTSEESGKDRFSIYQHPLLQGSQISALQSNTLMRKVKRTLPSPPPEEAHLPLASQAHSQLYLPSFMQKGVGEQATQVTKASLLRDIDRDLKLVEHESTKLRKKQAELDEEEKEIDAKLKYLELGITQRKESLLKERGGRDYPYPRCLGENRDYMSDSELNNLRLSSYEGSSLLSRPSTAPTNHYTDFSSTQYTSASSYAPYPYPAAPPGPAAFQQTRLQPPHYPVVSSGTSQNGFQAGQLPAFPSQSTYQTHSFPPSTGYQPQLGFQSHQGFRPPHHYQAQTTYPNQPPSQPAQSALFQTQADVHTMHQKPWQTSLADLEQKIPTNYEVIGNPTVVISSAAPEVTYSPTTVTSSYAQPTAPEARPADQSNAIQSPSASYSSDSLYTNLEQNIPRNYVMIEDISELTKESTAADSHKGEMQVQSSTGHQIKEKSELVEMEGSSRTCCYSKAEEESEEDMYDQHGADHRGKNSYHRGMESNGRMSGSSSSPCSYYGDDYRHSARSDKHGSGLGMQKHSSKNLAPAVISSKRSKHRKQGMEQKISKFSPIEEAKDVESDLASYTVTTSISSSNVASRAKKLQDEITYGLKKNVYEQQKYYGVSSRDTTEEDDRAYSTGSRSRSSGYGTEKSSSRDANSRSKSYERECMEKPQKGSSKPSSLNMSQSRGRPPIRTQTTEEESPISPLGKSVGMSRSSGGPLPQSSGDSCSQFCSSHSLPDVQEHIKDVPRNHSYKHEEGYIMDDSHCVVSDSEAYHLGQEETDWFDKPREARSERVRYYTGHSSSQKRPPIKHTFHDYDEPPDEDLWQHDDYSQARHSSSKDHRHHGEYGRHSASSRHPSDEQPRRTSKQHARDQGRHEVRTHMQLSAQKKAQQSDTRAQPAFPSSSVEYSQQSQQLSSYHHTSESQKSQRQAQHGPLPQQPKTEPLLHHSQQQSQTRQQQSGQQQLPSRQQQPSARQSPQQQAGPSQQPPQPQKEQQQQQARMQQQPGAQGPPSSRPPQQQPIQSQHVGKPQSTLPAQPGSHQVGLPKADQVDTPKPTTKVPPPHGRAPQAQPLGTTAAGIKVGQKPSGAPPPTGAAAGQSGVDGESVFSKILPGGAAEQAGKLTEAVSAFGKKFTSFCGKTYEETSEFSRQRWTLGITLLKPWKPLGCFTDCKARRAQRDLEGRRDDVGSH
ncbi:unnamed protein product [Caretta caretta]